MAIFSAGFVDTSKRNKFRERIYEKAQSELDSSAMKIAFKEGDGFVNYIAFLPKEKIKQQNILQLAHKLGGKNVIVFELDYKQVGVICEDGVVIDYILDKPQVFAKERDYGIIFADNFKGQALELVNMKKQKFQITISFIFLLLFIGILGAGLYGSYTYLSEYKIYAKQKQSLELAYEETVKKNLAEATKKIERIDSVGYLSDIETVTKRTNTRLLKALYKDGRFCVSLHVSDQSDLEAYDFSSVQVTPTKQSQEFEYCYEKI